MCLILFPGDVPSFFYPPILFKSLVYLGEVHFSKWCINCTKDDFFFILWSRYHKTIYETMLAYLLGCRFPEAKFRCNIRSISGLLFVSLPPITLFTLCLIMWISYAVICFHTTEARQAMLPHSCISLSYGIHWCFFRTFRIISLKSVKLHDGIWARIGFFWL